MSFESNSGLGVSNHYGPRDTGGTEGIVRTEGTSNEFMKDLDSAGLSFGFPSPATGKPSVWVTEVDISQVTGTVSAQTIGGVDVSAATSEAPVEVPAGNSGVIVLTGATGGNVLIKYKKYSRV